MRSSFLSVENLGIEFGPRDNPVKAVDGVTFEMAAGETLAVVGESGSGKSVTALALTRLVAEPPGRYMTGEIFFQGRDVLGMSHAALRALRGKQIAYIFQEPVSLPEPGVHHRVPDPRGDRAASA